MKEFFYTLPQYDLLSKHLKGGIIYEKLSEVHKAVF